MAPTLTWIDSFAHQAASQTYYGTNAGVFDSAQSTGSPFAFAAGRHAGSNALQITQDGANQIRLSKAVPAGNRVSVSSFYVKVAAAPAADSVFWNALASVNATLRFEASTGKVIYNSNAGGSPRTTSSGYCDGAWHRFDVKLVTSANPYTLDLQIDGVAQTQHTGANAANDITAVDLGTRASGGTGALTVNYA